MEYKFGSEYQVKDYSGLTSCEGFSEDLMETHLGLYAGYVKHTNKALTLLREGELDEYALGEVRRRLVWEFNGMRLHETFFDALTPGGAERPGHLEDALTDAFGSTKEWEKDIRNVAGMRGIGWACLTREGDTLLNTWVNEHDAGPLAGTSPVLLIDVFEHAFIRDFGTDKDAYMDALFANIDWDVVARRLQG